MNRIFITLFSFLAGATSNAYVMQCFGDISFWAQDHGKFVQIKLKNGQVYETDQNRTGVIHVGEYLKFPAVSIYPFFGINAKIINSQIVYETDHESFFKVSFGKKYLNCLVKTEAAF